MVRVAMQILVAAQAAADVAYRPYVAAPGRLPGRAAAGKMVRIHSKALWHFLDGLQFSPPLHLDPKAPPGLQTPHLSLVVQSSNCRI
jgi:hypothetical protein